MKYPFNKPYLSGKELHYIEDAVSKGKISGNGHYTKKCQSYFESQYGFKKTLLTTSCTDALEMAAILLDIQPGDQVIVPSFTFVSTANAFVLHGAEVVFADSQSEHPNIDAAKIKGLITPKTKAIVVVHYAGVACDMDPIMELADAHGIFVVEDAAQAIASTYKGRYLGGIGHLGAFSFHETKNLQCGEGGLLTINDDRFLKRSEIIWEKGTNRSAFFRGEVDKYGWVDVGSSFLPSELNAAYLWAQLEQLDKIQQERKRIWRAYHDQLQSWADALGIKLPKLPDYAVNNAHMFYLVCQNQEQRAALISHLKNRDILAVFHYQSLHRSAFFKDLYHGEPLENSDLYTACLLRLPLYYGLDVDYIIQQVKQFDGIQ
ncbi:dTDP-4-amino-4,6-dideoxygalactose transaminase [Gilvibacter sp. SZ-19]|uniref:dTDP-4-amino-4,6-dideoxygalactose transaminase n=1 Tax=Gilvibacter sp. SZ-19 TaxID=754429 RepID=UPI000B3C700B|nr:dTDP-4-amino-4,6-dideoxygalactose transaminase [Gilvibacter sp. SZ-19]ARV12818.1 dTDP-4-amino-4,6-dideoxygalactose transaminase [Gilvibacter sp. SZ-19]